MVDDAVHSSPGEGTPVQSTPTNPKDCPGNDLRASQDAIFTVKRFRDLLEIIRNTRRQFPVGWTLRTGDLASEVWLKMKAESKPIPVSVDSPLFIAYLMRRIRQILLDRRRRDGGDKRPAAERRLPLDLDQMGAASPPPADTRTGEPQGKFDSLWKQFRSALGLLAAEDPLAASVLEWHLWYGYTPKEIADLVNIKDIEAVSDARDRGLALMKTQLSDFRPPRKAPAKRASNQISQ